jgi:hypothetical protein
MAVRHQCPRSPTSGRSGRSSAFLFADLADGAAMTRNSQVLHQCQYPTSSVTIVSRRFILPTSVTFPPGQSGPFIAMMALVVS